jgi:MarR family transcriptional regulator, lower aerobic nicotinate degradation pathway regulator
MSKKPVPDQDDDRRILDCLRILVRELRSFAMDSERTTGLGAAQAFVLRVLARSPGLSVNALAERTLTHQSSVSAVIGRLEAGGLIRRTRCADDRRRIALYVTAKGSARTQRSPDIVQERFIDGLARLPTGTRRRLALDLRRWIDAMGIHDPAPAMFFESRRT